MQNETPEEKTFRHLKRCTASELEDYFYKAIIDKIATNQSTFPEDDKVVFPLIVFVKDEDFVLSIREENIRTQDWPSVLQYAEEVLAHYGWTLDEVQDSPHYYTSKAANLYTWAMKDELPYFCEDGKWWWSKAAANNFYTIHGFFPANVED